MYTLIKCLFKLLSLIPRRVMGWFAKPVGIIWFNLDRSHRRIAVDNMTIAFGSGISHERRKRMVQDNFVQLARVALELPSLMRLKKSNLESFVSFSGEEHLEEAYSNGHGILLLSAHFGNWELMAVATALRFGNPMHIVVRPLDYKPMNKLLMEIRTKTGNELISKYDSAGTIRKLLRKKQIIGILLDQNASLYEGVIVPFFGKITCTNKGLAMFALRYGTPVVPIFNIRQADGRYKIIIEAPLSLVKTGDVGQDLIANTMIFNQTIEKYIRLAPDNWFWVHRRWRLRGMPEKVGLESQGLTSLNVGNPEDSR